MALINSRLRAGDSPGSIAKDFEHTGITRFSLIRHRDGEHHLEGARSLLPVDEAQAPVEGDEHRGVAESEGMGFAQVLGKLENTLCRVEGVLERAIKEGHSKGFHEAVKSLLAVVDRVSALKGWVNSGSSAQVQVLIRNEVQGIGDDVMAVIRECPRCWPRLSKILDPEAVDAEFEVRSNEPSASAARPPRRRTSAREMAQNE
ncbi:MAG: hypothetical protein JW820_10685 [Spirochaetales bacterium]|nr:hypothetical protein [Spirochaetales bacterium]